MPIVEADPWREQYFRGVSCPAHVYIPTDDPDAWVWNPRHRWVYDKLRVAASQNLEAAPHGVSPRRFPVFSKPIFNLRGMGVGSRVLRDAAEYEQNLAPGHMWMPLLTGEHWSSDAAVVDGAVRWMRSARGFEAGGGTFDYWLVAAETPPAVRAYCTAWIAAQLPGYTGMVNLETMGLEAEGGGGAIIEVHLRFTDQWPDLYGAGWVESLVALHERGVWTFRDSELPRPGFSVVLFAPHGPRYTKPAASLIEELCRDPAITSVQITFHEDRPAARHAMPPGGFRLAIVNGWSLEAGRRARARLAAAPGLSFAASR